VRFFVAAVANAVVEKWTGIIPCNIWW